MRGGAGGERRADLTAAATIMPKAPKARGRRRAGEASGREALLTAALTCFAGRGFERASLRDIAAEADVDMALISRHFGSKAELWVAVVDRLAQRQVDHLAQLGRIAQQAKTEPGPACARFIALLAEISFGMPAFPAFLLQEASLPGERLDILIKDLVAPFRIACGPIIEAAVAAGVVRARDPDLFFGMLLSAVSLPMGSPILLGERGELTPRLAEAMTQEAVAMFMVTPARVPR